MAGEDLTSAAHAVPPEMPLAELEPATLRGLGRRVAARTRPLLANWFWGEGVCLLGLIRYAEAAGDPFPSEVYDFLHRTPVTVEHVNHVAPGTAAVLAWQATGNQRYADLAGRLIDWVATVPRGRDGVLEHWPGGVWADTVFMAGVFLAHAGATFGRPDLLVEAGRQLVRHGEILQHANGLIAHGSHRDETVWCFWGRANAWYALACVEFLDLAGDLSDPVVGEVRDRLTRQLTALVALQPDHGVWDVLVDGQPENRGILETSAAAGIGAAMLCAGRLLPNLSPAVPEAGDLAVRGALAYVADDGALTRVSAGTVLQLVPFGYSVIRDDRIQPWGQGLALYAIAAALRASFPAQSAPA
ncbi:MAG: glycoside hydrolase family 88 protein [Micromonosporaceae bacterium]